MGYNNCSQGIRYIITNENRIIFHFFEKKLKNYEKNRFLKKKAQTSDRQFAPTARLLKGQFNTARYVPKKH